MMKKGERYIGTVGRMAFPNRGLVEIDGETAVVKNALPGQEVEFAVSRKRGARCEGRLLRVVTPSLLEREPDRCPHFGVCGGCTFQSIPYEAQLRLKEQQIRELLAPVVDRGDSGEFFTRQMEGQVTGQKKDRFEQIFEGVKPSPVPCEYRNKMEFSFGDEEKGGPLALGLHRRGSFHDVVNVDGCRIVHPDFTLILKVTREYFAAAGLTFYKKPTHTGYLRHLLVRRAVKTGEILVALVTSGQTESKAARVAVTSGQTESKATRVVATSGQAERGNVGFAVTSGQAEHGNVGFATSGQAGSGDAGCVATSGQTGSGAAGFVVTPGQTGSGDTGLVERRNGLPMDAEDEAALLTGWRDALLALQPAGNAGGSETYPAADSLRGHFAGILHIRNDSLADVVQSDETTILYGQDYFYEELLGLRFQITPFSFFQTNSLGAEVLYRTVRDYVGDTKGKVVFDLYSGTGTIAQVLAPVAERVIGVEIVEEAVEAARRNAARNGLDNCEFIAGDVLKVLAEWSGERNCTNPPEHSNPQSCSVGRISGDTAADADDFADDAPVRANGFADAAPAEASGFPADTAADANDLASAVSAEASGFPDEKSAFNGSFTGIPDIIILDPPRDGLHPKVLDRIGGEIRARRIVYVSCKPTSLARDLEKLMAYGYLPERICCVDLFPSTSNIETCISLRCQNP